MPDRYTATGYLHERPTIDVVVLILATIVAVVTVTAVAVVAVLSITAPDANTEEVIALLDSHTGTILGALLGLVAGQNMERRRVLPAGGESFPTTRP